MRGAQADLSGAVHADCSKHLREALCEASGAVGKHAVFRFMAKRGKRAMCWATAQALALKNTADAGL